MPLDERDWTLLLNRNKDGKCTPFLGAGAAFGYIPVGTKVASDWAAKHHYPLRDTDDLPRVAQFLATEYGDAMFPKEQLAAEIEKYKPPDFTAKNEPHGALARLPLPLYITTNYDDFMIQAIRARRTTLVRSEICRWNDFVARRDSVFDDGAYEPTHEQPLVYHLHGRREIPESMVLTEDDYLDFLVELSKNPDLLPPPIQERMGGSSLLFLGYSLRDLNFRVLFRSLVTYLQGSLSRAHVSVQLEPDHDSSTEEQLAKIRDYLGKYFLNLKVRVYWGSCVDFVQELDQRWEAFQNGN
jgi:hypothetical protein